MYTFGIILIVNILGYLLKSNGYDRFLVLMGFRFHIGLIVPALIFFKKDFLGFAKNSFVKPEGGRYLIGYLGLLPLAIMTGLLYYFKIIDIGDPDYFYELGLSSVIDYPVYLLWNLPQLFILGLFLKNISEKLKYRFPLVFIVLATLFAYEFIPLAGSKLVVWDLCAYLASVLVFSILVSRFRDIYLFAGALFTVLWGYILVYGSASSSLLKMLLASQYEKWTGFMSVSYKFSVFMMPAFFLLVFVMLLPPLIVHLVRNK